MIRDPALQTDYDLSWAEVIDTAAGRRPFAADVMPVNETLFIAAGNCPRALRGAAVSYCQRVVAL